MIIVFGSNVLDLFFNQADLPPRDTAAHLESHVEAPGGKGANQAVAAAKAGGEVRFYGALGDGGHGRQMYKNLAQYGIDVSGIEFLSDVTSGIAAIFVDERDGTHRVVVSQGANLRARQSTIPDKHLGKDTIILVQGELPMKETEALLARGRKAGARSVMNLAPASDISEEALGNLDILVVNEHEADIVGQRLGMQTEDKILLVSKLYERFGLTTIVTMGPDGAVCCSGDGLMMVNSLSIKAIDTIGAGDAFVGYLCAMLDKKMPLGEALKYAAVAGSLACTKMGAQGAVPDAKEVLNYIGQITVSGQSNEPVLKTAFKL